MGQSASGLRFTMWFYGPLVFVIRHDHGNARSHGTSPPFFYISNFDPFLGDVMGQARHPKKYLLFVWARTEPTEGPCEGLGPKVTLTPPSLQVHVICPLRRGASVWDVVIWVQLIGQAVSH